MGSYNQTAEYPITLNKIFYFILPKKRKANAGSPMGYICGPLLSLILINDLDLRIKVTLSKFAGNKMAEL